MADVQLTYLQDLPAATSLQLADLLLVHQSGNEKSVSLSALQQVFQPLDATLTALSTLVGADNKLPYFNGSDTAALTDLTQAGRDIIGKDTVSDVLTYLGSGDGSLNGRLINIQIFTATGTYTPTLGAKKVIVEMVGGGGGGAGAEGTTSNISGGSGGGGGGYARYTTSNVPQSIMVTVGAGGSRGNGQSGGSTTNGGPGGESSFGTLAKATGGLGGTYSTVLSSSTLIQQLGGGNGSGTLGDLRALGQPGGKLLLTSFTNSTAGDGGASKFSFGPRAPGGGVASNGIDGVLGSGGAGALNTAFQAAGLLGGKGGDGIVLIWEYA